MHRISFSGLTERELLGERVEATEFPEAGIYHRTVYGTPRRDEDGLYIEDAEISYGFRMQRIDRRIPESGLLIDYIAEHTSRYLFL